MDEMPETEFVSRDSVYYLQLARAARLKAAATTDHDLSLRLRERRCCTYAKRGSSSAWKRMPQCSTEPF